MSHDRPKEKDKSFFEALSCLGLLGVAIVLGPLAKWREKKARVDVSQEKLVSQNYWESIEKKDDPQIVMKSEFEQFFNRYVPFAQKGETCLEIGCVPGRLLTYVARHKHYRPTGIDYSEESKGLKHY